MPPEAVQVELEGASQVLAVEVLSGTPHRFIARDNTRPSANGSGSQHLPEAADPPQGDKRTSPAMDRCAIFRVVLLQAVRA